MSRIKKLNEYSRIGQGTWNMGEDPAKRQAEVEALRLGLDLGMAVIDTAELYANGGSEEVVGEAFKNRRSEVFIVTKVHPANASALGTLKACENSLKRLNTDHIDLYLLHWRGPHPLQETLKAFLKLKQAGKILDFGVSNFDVDDVEEAFSIPGGKEIAANQVLYNLNRRGIEKHLLPWCQAQHLPIMAYTPIGDGKILEHSVLKTVAKKHQATPAQIALAWVIRLEGVMTIPKASSLDHVRENHGALKIKLTKQDLTELDAAFPLPNRKTPLEML